MRQFFLALMAFFMVMGGAMAQTKVIPDQVGQLKIAGNFKNGSTDTSYTLSFTSANLPLFTNRDTVRNAATAGDSARIRLVGEYNSVTLEVHATLDSGASGCDSVAVQFWGTATTGNGQGSFKLLQATNLTGTNGTEQVFTYVVSSGIGNPYTNYRVTVDVQDAINTCRASWQGWCLIR